MTPTSFTEQHSKSGRARLRRVLGIIGTILLVALGIVLLLGLLPQSTRDMQSVANPAQSYTDALARFQKIAAAEQGIVNDTGHSRLLVHGDKTSRAYVMVHGITNSPEQWQELGEMLHQQGHNVLILRMPYHGLASHRVSELTPITPQDLRAYADQAIDIAAGLGDEIFVVGISGGGTVAAWMAENRPEVDRALLLAPFFGIHGVPVWANTLLANAFSRLPNVVLDDPLEPRRDWAYRGQATRGVAAFLGLGQTIVDSLADGVKPASQVVVLTSARDHVANNESTARLAERWRTLGGDLVAYEFEPSLDIPHNSVDPAADASKKQQVYDRILDLLGESR